MKYGEFESQYLKKKYFLQLLQKKLIILISDH